MKTKILFSIIVLTSFLIFHKNENKFEPVAKNIHRFTNKSIPQKRNITNVVCILSTKKVRIPGTNYYGYSDAMSSGHLIHKNGYILATSHGITGAKKVTILFNGQTELDAKIIVNCPRYDYAILKISNFREPKPIQFIDEKEIYKGMPVQIIGYKGSRKKIIYKGKLNDVCGMPNKYHEIIYVYEIIGKCEFGFSGGVVVDPRTGKSLGMILAKRGCLTYILPFTTCKSALNFYLQEVK